MLIDDLVGEDVDPELDGALVVFNASPEAITQSRSTGSPGAGSPSPTRRRTAPTRS